jgi:lysophospholipase L1-like esterase
VNYQNLLCVGDSQTFGARSYGCYPLHLARILTNGTPYAWRAINLSVNGYTARDLWFMLNKELAVVRDVRQACVLIGANDVGEDKDPQLFEEYYRQILRAFFVSRFKAVWCGEIPPIHPDGHIYFDRACQERRKLLNARLEAVVAESAGAHLVRLGHLGREHYEDSAHFSESGNVQVAEAFAREILAR